MCMMCTYLKAVIAHMATRSLTTLQRCLPRITVTRDERFASFVACDWSVVGNLKL